MLKQISDAELFKRPLPTERKAEILALIDRDVRDEDIDTSDIPELKEIPPDTVRGKMYRGNVIGLNPELRRYFTELSSRKGVPMNDL